MGLRNWIRAQLHVTAGYPIQQTFPFDPPESFSESPKEHPELKDTLRDYMPSMGTEQEEDEWFDGFYHVTTNLPAVASWGALKSRDQLGQEVMGLGGGFKDEASDMVSLTHNLGKANQIYEGLVYAAEVAHGMTPPSAILSDVINWMGFPDDFLDESPLYGVLRQYLTKKQISNLDWVDLGKALDTNPDLKGPKERYGFMIEVEDAIMRFEQEGEQEYPTSRVGFTTPFETFSKINPSNIGIVQLRLRKGAPVEHVPQEQELRVSPDDIQIVRVEKSSMSKVRAWIRRFSKSSTKMYHCTSHRSAESILTNGFEAMPYMTDDASFFDEHFYSCLLMLDLAEDKKNEMEEKYSVTRRKAVNEMAEMWLNKYGNGSVIWVSYETPATEFGETCLEVTLPDGCIPIASDYTYGEAYWCPMSPIPAENFKIHPNSMAKWVSKICKFSASDPLSMSQREWVETNMPGLTFDQMLEEQNYGRMREIRNDWNRAMEKAVATGRVGPEEAEKKKFQMDPYHGPMPNEPLFHVTTAKDIVIAEGLKTRDELKQSSGKGLGGGASNTISFTTDFKIAKGIYSSLKEARAFVTGENDIYGLIKMAEKGIGAKRPWINDWMGYILMGSSGTDFKWKGELPARVQWLIDGYDLKQTVMPEDAEKMAEEGWEPMEQYRWPHGTNPNLYTMFKRKMDPAKQRDELFQLFKSWSVLRQEAGGPMDPCYFLSDPNALAQVPEDQIAILQFKAKPKSYGYQVGGLTEWRTYSGDAVEFVRDVSHLS